MAEHATLHRARAYSSDEAIAIAGITYRQLGYWTQRGVIGPSVSTPAGPGTKARWSANDIRSLRVLGELLRLGVDLDTARLVPELLDHDQAYGWLLVGPGRVRHIATDLELVDALTRDEPAWHVIRLATILHGLPTDATAAA